MAFCRNGGTKLGNGVKFCPNCGTPTDYSSAHDEDYENEEEYDEKPRKFGCWSTHLRQAVKMVRNGKENFKQMQLTLMSS